MYPLRLRGTPLARLDVDVINTSAIAMLLGGRRTTRSKTVKYVETLVCFLRVVEVNSQSKIAFTSEGNSLHRFPVYWREKCRASCLILRQQSLKGPCIQWNYPKFHALDFPFEIWESVRRNYGCNVASPRTVLNYFLNSKPRTSGFMSLRWIPYTRTYLQSFVWGYWRTGRSCPRSITGMAWLTQRILKCGATCG